MNELFHATDEVLNDSIERLRELLPSYENGELRDQLLSLHDQLKTTRATLGISYLKRLYESGLAEEKRLTRQ